MNGAYSILGKLSYPIKKRKKKKHKSIDFKNSKSVLYFISIFFVLEETCLLTKELGKNLKMFS
jgi:hypothetical protein